MKKLKLQKVIQSAGFDSRRNIRKSIHDGEFTVNTTVVTDPNFLVDINTDVVRFMNKKIHIQPEQKCYFLFNKPNNVVSTLKDPEGRATVKDFIGQIKERVYPVGRLDYHSEGLMLLTNDGDLANAILAAKNGIPKVYHVKIKGTLSDEERDKLLTKGIYVDGTRVKPLRIETTKKTAQENSWLKVTIVEGKKHIIRNMFLYSNHPVEKLKRLSIGTFELNKIPPGHWHEIGPRDVATFKKKYELKF